MHPKSLTYSLLLQVMPQNAVLNDNQNEEEDGEDTLQK